MFCCKNVISYGSAISACEEGRKVHQALGLLVEMRHIDLLPNVISYCSAITWINSKGNGEESRGGKSERIPTFRGNSIGNPRSNLRHP